MGSESKRKSKKRLKETPQVKSTVAHKGIPLLLIGAAGLVSGMIYAQPVHAEGSKDLIANGGYRPYLEWNTATLSGITRRTIIQVYAKEGETINLGSSVSTATGNLDIVATDPNGNAVNLDVIAAGVGHIDTLAKEQNGPRPGSGGYTPHTIVVGPGQEGIWNIEFRNPATPSAAPRPVKTTDAFPVDHTQGRAVAAWDVTVQDGLGNDQSGRVFTSYLALNMGSNTTVTYPDMALNSKLYILTKDGYRYETEMNGLDPYVFMFFANNRGFLDTNGRTLYHSITSPDAGSTFEAGVTVQNPELADAGNDITHRVFLNTPAGDLPPSMPTVATAPSTPTNFQFEGSTDNASPLGAGGTFSFDTAQFGSFQIVVDTTGPGGVPDGVYDPTIDVVLGDVAQAGHNAYVWNGKDRNGVDVPARKYNAKLYVKAGEYHFPLIDAETSTNGLKIQLQNAPNAYPAHANMNAATLFYDDSSYTIEGTPIDLDPLFYQTASTPRNASDGLDSSTGVHKFTAGYGDNKGIDTWTYFPSDAVYSSLIVTNATVTGNVFADMDGDGVQDAGELGIAGVQVKVTDVNGDEVTLTTDAAGNYNANVLAGAVSVQVDTASAPLAALRLTTANDSQTFAAVVGANTTGAVGYTANRPPVIPDDTDTTPANTPKSDSTLGTDPDGDALTYSKGSDPTNGTVVVNADGTWTYTPNAGYTGMDSFTINVTDGFGGTDSGTVTITVTNTPPVATDDTKTTAANTPVSGTVTATDADGHALTFSKATDPTNGTVVVNGDGTYTYTPNVGYTGTDSFTVMVVDGHGGSDTAQVTITVTNTPPVAVDDTKTTPVNTPVGGTVTATDADGHALTYSKASDPTNGTVVVNADGTWTYTPNVGYTGADSFTVTVNDGHGGTDTATVNITVTAPANQPPTTADVARTTPQNTPVSGNVTGTDPDGDALTYTKATDPTNGTVVVNPDGTFTYTPNLGYVGVDTFTVTVDDGRGGTATSTVTITVTPPANQPPTTADVPRTTPQDTPVSGTVTGVDPDGDALTYTKTTDPTNGTVVVNPDGTFTYTPNPGYVGVDTFTVTVDDGRGGTAVSTVTVTVTPPPPPGNQPPTTADLTRTTPINTPVSGNVTGADPDGDALTFTKTSDPANGTVVVNADGSFTYTPNNGFTGVDIFTVTVDDGRGGTALSTITVTVTAPPAPPAPPAPAPAPAPNHPPTTADMTKTTTINTPVADTLSGTDPDGDTLTFTKVTDPAHGTVSITPNGVWSYVPAKDFTGTDTFTVQVSDGRGGTATAKVTVTIVQPNRPPVISDDSKETAVDTPVPGKVTATDRDGDTLTYKVDSKPAHGTVTLQEDGSYVYTPNTGFTGEDTFTVVVSDGKGGTATGLVTITVNPPADTEEENTVQGTEVDGEFLPQGFEDEEVIYETTEPSEHGTVILSSNGTWTYIPDSGFVGEDRFTITVRSKSNPLKQRSKTIVVRVAPKPAVPQATPQSVEATPDIQTLPKTGSFADRNLLYGAGSALMALGAMLRFRRRKRD